MALGHVADMGLLEQADDSVRLTEACDVFVISWLKRLEQPRRPATTGPIALVCFGRGRDLLARQAALRACWASWEQSVAAG